MMPGRSEIEEAVVIEPILDAEVLDHDLTKSPQRATCDACGSPLAGEDRFCTACGTPRAIPDEPSLGNLRHLRCETCSAEIATDTESRSYTCPFCDSTYVVEFSPDQSDRRRPEFVIGFAITREQALQTFRNWLKQNQWFRPQDLSTAAIEDKQRGVYLPFWSFSAKAHSRWRSSIGEYWYTTEYYYATVNGKRVQRSRRVQHTEWWTLQGQHHHYYGGYLISASRGLPQADAQQIQPFDLSALARYRPHFLAGWLSEEYSVDREHAWKVCQDHFFRMEQSNIARLMPGDRHKDLFVESNFHHTGTDLILLPVHVLSYRYGDKVFRFLVNGQTGKFAGEKPVSKTRISVAVTVVVLIVIAIIVLIIMGTQG